ncbi:unnamed protein product, partial [Scytosiphon promiscuus]
MLSQGRALTGASIVQTWLDGKRKPSALFPQPATNSTANDSDGGKGRQPETTLSTSGIWALDKDARKTKWNGWEAAIKAEVAVRVAGRVAVHDSYARQLSGLQLKKDLQRVASARIIGCTTTGAAMH